MTEQTWILTGSPENFDKTRELGFTLIGLKEHRHRQALEIAEGDRIVFYLTRVMCFAASARIASELWEERTPVWPGKPGDADAYPWRFQLEPELELEQSDWLPAESLVDELDHIRKWPREHWKLAFQGQLRAVSQSDSELLLERMTSAGAVSA
ncbi:MAG: EVE domain-containing protein [Solirubrobacteraceae bacterium]